MFRPLCKVIFSTVYLKHLTT